MPFGKNHIFEKRFIGLTTGYEWRPLGKNHISEKKFIVLATGYEWRPLGKNRISEKKFMGLTTGYEWRPLRKNRISEKKFIALTTRYYRGALLRLGRRAHSKLQILASSCFLLVFLNTGVQNMVAKHIRKLCGFDRAVRKRAHSKFYFLDSENGIRTSDILWFVSDV